MLGIDSVNILDGKIVDHEGEGDRTGGMTEKSRRVLDWHVIGKGQVLDRVVVGYDASLWKAIHAFSNLGEEMAIVDKRSEVVLLHDVGRNVFCRDAHVSVAIHKRAEVKNFNVGSEHFCVWGGHGAVEENFDGL